VAREPRIKLRSTRNLAGKLLESLALGLGDEEGGEAAQQHEEGVYLHDVVEPRALVRGGGATCAERADEDLGDDGADLAGGGRDAVGGGTVTCWETFTWHYESGGVWARVKCASQLSVPDIVLGSTL
jgi:hypothetical protein